MMIGSTPDGSAAMAKTPDEDATALAAKSAAPQHRPRPLPLFLSMLRSETGGDAARMGRALEGLRRYQEAGREPSPAPPAGVAQLLGSTLRDYGGKGPAAVFVPSLINPPSILDLAEGQSLLRWLAAEGGVRPLLVDWGWDVAARRDLSVAGHVEAVLLPLLAALGEPAALVGYCLGGTMALGAAARVEVRGVATIAAPWRFSGFPDDARAMLARLWAGTEATAARLGMLPMEALQSAFWALDPARTVAKFEAFAGVAPESAEARAFVRLEDWANDGPPLPYAAAKELFEGFFRDDATGRGEWLLADPRGLSCPVLEIVSTTDRIVPAATAAGAGERIETARGHVGMVVGGSARDVLWAPLAEWLCRQSGSR
jgi:polyhydroxyalkanoate synthase